MKGSVSPGLAIGAAAVGVFAVLALLFGFTVVSTEEEADLNVEFDPVAYVDENWETSDRHQRQRRAACGRAQPLRA